MVEGFQPHRRKTFSFRKENIMSLINSLLTGGTIIGKIAQSLIGAFSKSAALSNGSKLAMADLVVGGGKFMQSDDNEEHVMKTYLLNPTDSRMSLSIPDDGSGGAVEYIVKSFNKFPIDDCMGGKMAPDTKVMIGPVNAVSSLGAGGVPDAAVKLSFKNLTIGMGSVSVGGFTFQATPTGLLVTCGMALAGMVYFYMRGRHGVAAEGRHQIPPAGQNDGGTAGAATYRFDINFAELGFMNGETLEEVEVHFSADGNALEEDERASRSEPLTDAEREYFLSINLIKG